MGKDRGAGEDPFEDQILATELRQEMGVEEGGGGGGEEGGKKKWALILYNF